MDVPVSEPDVIDGVLEATMVIDDEALPLDAVGILNENTDVLPFLNVYQVLRLKEADLLAITVFITQP